MANQINPETIITSAVSNLISRRHRNMSDRLWGKVLSHFPVVRADLAGKKCRTMYVDGKNIYYNPNFVRDVCLDAVEQKAEALLADRIKFLLAHEIMHVVYRNITEKDKDTTYDIPGPHDKAYRVLHKMANCAQDAVINARLKKEFGESKIVKTFTKRDKNGNPIVKKDKNGVFVLMGRLCFYEGEIEKTWTQLFVEVCNKMNEKMAQALGVEIKEYPDGFYRSIELFRSLYPEYDEKLGKKNKKDKPRWQDDRDEGRNDRQREDKRRDEERAKQNQSQDQERDKQQDQDKEQEQDQERKRKEQEQDVEEKNEEKKTQQGVSGSKGSSRSDKRGGQSDERSDSEFPDQPSDEGRDDQESERREDGSEGDRSDGRPDDFNWEDIDYLNQDSDDEPEKSQSGKRDSDERSDENPADTSEDQEAEEKSDGTERNGNKQDGDGQDEDPDSPDEESEADKALNEIIQRMLDGDTTIDDHDQIAENMKENGRVMDRKLDRVMQDIRKEMQDAMRHAGNSALGTSMLIELCNRYFRPKPEPWYVGISLLLKNKIREGRQVREKIPPIEMLTQVMTGNSVVQFEKADRRLDIAFAVDVSGSMNNDEVLSGVLKILAYLERNIPKGTQGHRFIFCQVDAGIEEWKEMRIPSREYSQWKRELTENGFTRKGSGGTVFAPFFEKIAGMKNRPDAIIVFSDMDLYDYPNVEKAMEKFRNNVIWLCSREEVPKEFYEHQLGRVYETSSLFEEPEISR